MSGQVTAAPTGQLTKAEIDADIRRLSKTVEDETKPLDQRAVALCRIMDHRRDELLAGVDSRIDRGRLMESVKMIVREYPDRVVGCTLSSVMRSVKSAMLSGLVIDKFKGEVDFIPRNKKMKLDGKEVWVKELHADPNYRGLVHLVNNTGKTTRPPVVECVYEGEEFEFVGESDEMRIVHKKNPLNEYRAASDTSKIVVVYCRWYFDNRTVDHFMTMSQIHAHRDKYSKAYGDAEKNGRRDSFWHKEPLKAAFKTMLRDAVNRDLVPISRVDRGYVLQEQAAESSEWAATDVVDAEFSVGSATSAETTLIDPQQEQPNA